MASDEVDLSFLSWKRLRPMLLDNSYQPQEIQKEMKLLYADIIEPNKLWSEQTTTSITDTAHNKYYIELTDKSIQDQRHDLEGGELDKDDKVVSKVLQHRIRELWQRFLTIRENREIVMDHEIIDAFLRLCVSIMERTIRRRIAYIVEMWDEQILGY